MCHFLKVHNLFITRPQFLSPHFFRPPLLFQASAGEAPKNPSYLKKSCAHGPAGGEGRPGSTYAHAHGVDSRTGAYVLNPTRARFAGLAGLAGSRFWSGSVVWSGSGMWSLPRSGVVLWSRSISRSGEVFYAPGSVSWKIYLYAPYSPPNQSKIRQNSPNSPRKFVQKKFPTPPFRGAGGKANPEQALY